MDQLIYERLFSTRAYLVIQKSEALCHTCKYESIKPIVLFLSMLIVEKEFIRDVIHSSNMDYASVCQKVEGKLNNISIVHKDAYTFSEESCNIITSLINNKTQNEAITIVDLLRELVTNDEILDLIDNKRLNIPEQPEKNLVWNNLSGTFEARVLSYYEHKIQSVVTDIPKMCGFCG